MPRLVPTRQPERRSQWRRSRLRALTLRLFMLKTRLMQGAYQSTTGAQQWINWGISRICPNGLRQGRIFENSGAMIVTRHHDQAGRAKRYGQTKQIKPFGLRVRRGLFLR